MAKTNNDPAFLFYSSDFLVGTIFMPYEQKGKYITLLCMQHQIGHLTKEQVNSVCNDDVVLSKFSLDKKGLFFNKRLDDEVEKRASYKKNRLKNLAGKGSKGVSHMGDHMDTPHGSSIRNPKCEDENENENEDINRDANANKKVKRFVPPTIQEVDDYCQERNNTVDPERFVDFYSAKGWMIGKNKVKDWKACVRTWEKNNQGTNKGNNVKTFAEMAKEEMQREELYNE